MDFLDHLSNFALFCSPGALAGVIRVGGLDQRLELVAPGAIPHFECYTILIMQYSIFLRSLIDEICLDADIACWIMKKVLNFDEFGFERIYAPWDLIRVERLLPIHQNTRILQRATMKNVALEAMVIVRNDFAFHFLLYIWL